MDDGDPEGLHTALHSDPRLVVATALATLVIAGSAFIWRSNPRHIVGNSHNQLGPETSKSAGTSSKSPTAGTAIIVRDELGDESETKELKVARSKERRRRGKDPLKDILKNVKKTKVLAKPTRTGDPEDGGAGQANTLPKINEVTHRSRKASNATSSRSFSSTSNRRSPLPSQDRVSSYPSSNQGSHTGDGDDEDEEDTPPAASSSMPKIFDSLPSDTQPPPPSLSPPNFHASQTSSSTMESDPPAPSRTTVSPNIPLSSSSSTSQSTSTHSSDSAITPNTSPTLSQSGKTPTLAQVDMAPHAQTKSMVGSASSPAVHQTQKPLNPWDWDGAGPPATSDGMYRKPPRFRSKSRGSGSISMSPSIPVSFPMDNYPSDLATSSPRVSSPTMSTILSLGSVGLHDDFNHSFTFPPDTSAKRSSDPPTPGPSQGGNNTNFNGNGTANGNANTPRRAPTPRRPPTPLSGTGTPSPSLSTQTQLASLRGALEAARLREEKTKVDIERYSKELEMMCWESAAWRRREAELQAQVHHLVHQLQTYTALFTSMPGQPSPLPQHPMPPGANPNPTSNSVPNGYQFSPPSSNPHSPPPLLQIPSAQMLLRNGLLSSPSILSPMSMAMAHTSPHSPFYPYSTHPSHPYPLPQQQQQQAQSPLQQSNNAFSMMFPHPVNTNGGTDLAGPSSTPPPTSSDRGRRLTRTRTQTAGPRISERGGGNVWDDERSENWHVGDDDVLADDGEDPYSDEDDEEGSVNEVLVDAILKRPASIRGLSRKGKFKEKVDKEKEVQHTEFTFPSLSDFGNVNRMYSVPMEAPVEGGLPDDSANDEGLQFRQAGETTETPQPARADQPDLTVADLQQDIPS